MGGGAEGEGQADFVMSVEPNSSLLKHGLHSDFLLKSGGWGAWGGQWVKASAFGSGHGLRVLGSSPTSGSLPAGSLLLPSLSACLSAYL